MTYIEQSFPIKEISTLALKEGNSKRPVYQLHKWWARRLSSVVRGLIVASTLSDQHTEEDFWNAFYGKNSLDEYTIMDIFMGGGSSLVEAKKMGAKTIGIDIDPLACFITRKELEAVDFQDLQNNYIALEQNISNKIRSFYTTKINDKERAVINFFWVYRVSCPDCNIIIDAHPHFKVYHTQDEQGVICQSCGKLHIVDIKRNILTCEACKTRTHINKGPFSRGKCTCPQCKNTFDLKEHVHGSKSLHLFALEYEENGKRFYKEATYQDLQKYNAISDEFLVNKDIYNIPTSSISIANENDKRPHSHGYYFYQDLFNNRQLFSLGILLKEILKIEDKNIQSWFLLAFSDALASNNMLCSYAFGYRKLTPLFGIHAYTVPARPVENNVWGTGGLGRGSFEKVFNKMLRSKAYCKKTYEIKIKNNQSEKINTGEIISSIVTDNSEKFYANEADSLILNQSSERLDEVRNNSVDLILTDPPYYDNLHYSHLADFYFQWLKKFIKDNETDPTANSLFAQNNDEATYYIFKNRLENIFKEAYKKLSDNGMMVFSYHHNKENAWKAIGEALKNSNFIITKIFPVRSEGQSAYHSSEQTIKWDSILIVRKKEFTLLTESLDFKDIINTWHLKINKEKLTMNKNDKLSFFRSLAIQCYVNRDLKIDTLFKELEY